MQNLKLTISYDGTGFHGWQIQPDQQTIQGILTDLLRQLTQEPVTLFGAGRTDAGVHASGQVANFVTASALPGPDFARALNALLPAEIRIRNVEEVPASFHARWHAQAKTYRYRICRSRVVSPFAWRYVLQEHGHLDFAAMAEAAQSFVGEHDFSSFAASTGCEAEDHNRITRRCIFSSEMIKLPGSNGMYGPPENIPPARAAAPSAMEGEEWVFLIRGRSFLRHMVRKMTGTLLEVGRGRLTPKDIPLLLALGDRTRSGPTVPPQGLCLMSVEYPEAPHP